MTAPATAPQAPAESTPAFILFVVGDEPNSHLARERLATLCAEGHLDEAHIEVVDVLDDVQAAIDHGILLTPTLLRLRPAPEVRVIGNLRDLDKVRAALGL